MEFTVGQWKLQFEGKRQRKKEGKEDSTTFCAFLWVLIEKYILKYQILKTTSNEDRTSSRGRVQAKQAQTTTYLVWSI